MAPEASRFASVRSPALPRPSPSSVVTPDHAGDASGSREKQKKGGQRVRDSRGSRRNGKSKEKIFNKKESSNISSNESTTTPGSTPRTIEDTSTADSSDHFVSRSGATGRSTLYVRGHSDAASEPSIVSLTNLIHHIESLSADLRDSPLYSDHPDNPIRLWHGRVDGALKLVGDLWSETQLRAELLRTRAEKAETRLSRVSAIQQDSDETEVSSKLGVNNQETRQIASSSPNCKLYVGGLHHSAVEADLRKHFRQYGHVIDTDVVLAKSGRSRGHGSVTFANYQMAESAVEKSHGSTLKGKKISVRWFLSSKDEGRDANNAGMTAERGSDGRRPSVLLDHNRDAASPQNVFVCSSPVPLSDSDKVCMHPTERRDEEGSDLSDPPTTLDIDIRSKGLRKTDDNDCGTYPVAPVGMEETKGSCTAHEESSAFKSKPPSLIDIMREEKQQQEKEEPGLLRVSEECIEGRGKTEQTLSIQPVLTRVEERDGQLSRPSRDYVKESAFDSGEKITEAEMARINGNNEAVEQQRQSSKPASENGRNGIVDPTFLHWEGVTEKRELRTAKIIEISNGGKAGRPQNNVAQENDDTKSEVRSEVNLPNNLKPCSEATPETPQSGSIDNLCPSLSPLTEPKIISPSQNSQNPSMSLSPLTVKASTPYSTPSPIPHSMPPTWKRKIEVEDPDDVIEDYKRRAPIQSSSGRKSMLESMVEPVGITTPLYSLTDMVGGPYSKPISPLFSMLQDESSTSRVRRLLPYEYEIVFLKKNEVGIRGKIASCKREMERIEESFVSGMDKHWKSNGGMTNEQKRNQVVYDKMRNLETRRASEMRDLKRRHNKALAKYSVKKLEVAFGVKRTQILGKCEQLEREEEALRVEGEKISEKFDRAKMEIEESMRIEREKVIDNVQKHKDTLIKYCEAKEEELRRELASKTQQTFESGELGDARLHAKWEEECDKKLAQIKLNLDIEINKLDANSQVLIGRIHENRQKN